MKLLSIISYFSEHWHRLLEDCIVYVDENIRAAALEALPPFWTTYYEPTSEEKLKWRDDLITRYTQALNTDKEIQSLGYAAALGKKLLFCFRFSFH